MTTKSGGKGGCYFCQVQQILSVRTFKTLGKVHANLHYHVHMHTTKLPGIDMEVAKQL
ncbi:hypothetical protein BDR04DRAFT_1094720, partial [Suillus decipiens]